MIEQIKNQLQKAIKEKIGIEVFASEKENFGHYSTNMAFKFTPTNKASSGMAGKTPFEIAKEIASKLSSPPTSSKSIFAKIEAVSPGFVNFWLKPEILQNELKAILKQKNKYGSLKHQTPNTKHRTINLEFVSANPTGPLTMANGRAGFYGDVLANVLENSGHKVTREYYINDAGNQIKLLGESILAAEGKIPWKDEYYKGEYVKDLVKSLKLKVKNYDGEKIGKKAAKILFKEIKKSLKNAGIKHDIWFSEDKNLHKKGELKKTLKFLKGKKVVYEKDGAMWLKDAVLIKSDGNPTYFLADLAYHYDKFLKRKFDLAIDIWGADHHGYKARMESGIRALGVKPKRLKILITQLVRLISKGKEVKMSKRAGEFVTLDDLLKEVGLDAARFFFLMHSLDTHMDFDMDLAKERSQKNPVYYVQYAFVRCLHILRKATSDKRQATNNNLKMLNSITEIKLMLELMKFPDVLAQTVKDYQVHRLTEYAARLARSFHNFYEKERVIDAEPETAQARLALVSATKIALENLFSILGISKPKKM